MRLDPAGLPPLLAALRRIAAPMEGLRAAAEQVRAAILAHDLDSLRRGTRRTEELAAELARQDQERAALVRSWSALPGGALEPALETLADELPPLEAVLLRAAGAELEGLARSVAALERGNARLLERATGLTHAAALWMAGLTEERPSYGPQCYAMPVPRTRLLDQEV